MTISVRRLMGLVAAVAVAAALVQRWDFHRRGPASEKLLRPIIVYYDEGADHQYREARAGLKFAIDRSSYLPEDFAARAARLALLAIARLSNPPGAGPWWDAAISDLRGMRSDYDRFVHRGHASPSELDHYRRAALSLQLATYCAHLSEYYRRLRAEHRTAIPPSPPELEAERQALQATWRRTIRDPTFEFPTEPPWHLVPGTPRPRPKGKGIPADDPNQSARSF
jgi:hypothetical protein